MVLDRLSFTAIANFAASTASFFGMLRRLLGNLDRGKWWTNKYFGVDYTACNVCDARVLLRRLTSCVLLGATTRCEGSTSTYQSDHNKENIFLIYGKFIQKSLSLVSYLEYSGKPEGKYDTIRMYLWHHKILFLW